MLLGPGSRLSTASSSDVVPRSRPYQSILPYEQPFLGALVDDYSTGDNTSHHWYYGNPNFQHVTAPEKKGHVDLLAADLMKKCILGRPPKGRAIPSPLYSVDKPLDRRRCTEMMATGDDPFMQRYVLHAHQGKVSHPHLTDLQREVLRYRGLLRTEDREERRVKDLQSRPLRARKDLVHSHGLWLASGCTGSTTATANDDGRSDKEPWIPRRLAASPRPSYWGGMVGKYGLQAKARTSFQKGTGHLLGFGIRNSVNLARRGGIQVKKVGSLVAVCGRSFDEEHEQPSQSLLEVVMGRSAKIDRLRYKLRYRMLCVFLQILESPLNPPGVSIINIDKLHDHLQATAFKNPQPWFVSRHQFVAVIRRLFQGVDERMAHQLVSCYDPMLRHRIRFAEITSNLLAANHSSAIALCSLPDDLGPYKVLFTVFRTAFRFYSTATADKLTYLVLLDLFRSYANKPDDITDIDQAFHSMMVKVSSRNGSSSSGGVRLDSEITLETALAHLRECPEILEVLQGKLSEFQALVVVEHDKDLALKNAKLNREPVSPRGG